MSVLSTSGIDVMGGVAPQPDGSIEALWYAGSKGALTLDILTPDATKRVTSWPVSAEGLLSFGLVGAPDGSIFVSAATGMGLVGQAPSTSLDLGDGPVSGIQVTRMTPNTTHAVATSCLQDDCSLALVAVSAAGDQVWRMGGGDAELYTLTRPAKGTDVVLWSWRVGAKPEITGPLASVGCFVATFTPDGNLVCGGTHADDGSPVPSGQGRLATRPAVAKVDLTGKVLWTAIFPGVNGQVTSLGTTAKNTVVAAGSFVGEGTFGSDKLSHAGGTEDGGFLAVFEADGQARFARQLPSVPRALAVDPLGRAAVAYQRRCSDRGLAYYDLAGTLRWTRSLPVSCDGVSMNAAASDPYLAIATNQDVIAADRFSGSWDFGTGEKTAADVDAYVLAIAP